MQIAGPVRSVSLCPEVPMADQPDRPRTESNSPRAEDRPLDDPALDPSGGIGDLGEESGTAPWQPARGTRAVAPSAGEGLWVG